MAASSSVCRGFTHPVLLLIRSSFHPNAQRTFFTARQSPCFRSTTSRPLTRLFSTSRHLLNQVKTVSARNPQHLRPSASAKLVGQEARPAISSSYAHKLAQSKHGTILYEGAPQKIFILSSFMAGFVCMGAAGINVYFNVYNVPPGVPAWTGYAFGSLGLVLAILGMNFALMPSGIVRMIRVLPAAAVEASSASKTAGAGLSKVKLEVVARRLSPLPGLPLKRMVVEPKDIVLNTRMYSPKLAPTEIEKLRMNQEWAKRKKAQKEYDDIHRMTVPFRDAKWALSTIFSSIRRGLTGEGFARIEVGGTKYRLDIQHGYVFEDGRPLDRLVKIEPAQKTTPLLSR
ncbi:hypothetical protein BJ170DRAFT_336571 [Xylariales sp. AK1849]|nr:hypothetical protein BJ170DRAFT_336571 [Xylariales sp. AK1849]